MNIGFIAFAVYGAIVTSAMVWATCQAPPENSTAIVLGAQVKPWGPSVILRGRIDAAKSYLDDSPNANAVLSGGQGSDEIMSEAQFFKTLYGGQVNQHNREYKKFNKNY